MRTRLLAVAALVLLSSRADAAIHRIVLDGPIDPVHAEFLVRAMDQAEAEGSDLILLEVNTPGGMMDAMETILQRMLKSRAPVCVFVYPPGGKAASAGFFLLVSADVAAMAPGTRAGAAHPILAIGGVLPLPEEPPKIPVPTEVKPPGEAPSPTPGDQAQPAPKKTEPASESTLMSKIRQDAEAYLRSIAERRGRDAKAAELAVSESKSYTDQEALAARLVDVVAAGEPELLAKLHGREVRRLDGTVGTLSTEGAAVVEIPMTFRERALAFLVNPNVAFLLFLVGALLVYIEVTHAGMVLPGVTGGLCLLLAVTGFSFLPVTATGVLLILAAAGLFVAEVFVQSFGVLGIVGVVCLALGGIMLVDVPEGGIAVDPYLAVAAAVAFGAIVVFLATLAIRAMRRRSVTGSEGLVGLMGDAVTALEPRGKVRIGAEYWDAVATASVRAGGRVRVVSVNGLLLTVEAADEDGTKPA
jgi:membrane-bound serine protease (ClpP class)